jgi:hypothetical protein
MFDRRNSLSGSLCNEYWYFCCRTTLPTQSPRAFSFCSAVCEKESTVHFSTTDYAGGILEFMGTDFMKSYHKDVFDACTPPGNISSVADWSLVKLERPVIKIPCLPLAMLLRRARVSHVNFFILDVEGGELSILKSIDFNAVKFDVICIETTPNERPPGYAQQVIDFLAPVGYVNATGQVGRNICKQLLRNFISCLRELRLITARLL